MRIHVATIGNQEKLEPEARIFGHCRNDPNFRQVGVSAVSAALHHLIVFSQSGFHAKGMKGDRDLETYDL